jgi:hypothetical protein
MIFRWPLFALLAVVHLLVLPRTLSEPEDVRLSVIAGIVYLALAIADLIYTARRNP